MARSKDEVAKALEEMASGQAEAQPQERKRYRQPTPPPDDIPLPPPRRVSRAAGPLPGKPGVPVAQESGTPALGRGIVLRQTVIPSLLMLGILMPASGTASLVMRDESPLAEHPLVSVLLILLGLLILIAAVVNMLHVRHAISVREAISVSGKR